MESVSDTSFLLSSFAIFSNSPAPETENQDRRVVWSKLIQNMDVLFVRGMELVQEAIGIELVGFREVLFVTHHSPIDFPLAKKKNGKYREEGRQTRC